MKKVLLYSVTKLKEKFQNILKKYGFKYEVKETTFYGSNCFLFTIYYEDDELFDEFKKEILQRSEKYLKGSEVKDGI